MDEMMEVDESPKSSKIRVKYLRLDDGGLRPLDEDECEIKRIRNVRFFKSGLVEYLVDWQGSRGISGTSSWVAESNIITRLPVELFWQQRRDFVESFDVRKARTRNRRQYNLYLKFVKSLKRYAKHLRCNNKVEEWTRSRKKEREPALDGGEVLADECLHALLDPIDGAGCLLLLRFVLHDFRGHEPMTYQEEYVPVLVNEQFGEYMSNYILTHQLYHSDISFFYKSEKIRISDTAAKIGLKNDDLIEVYAPRPTRCHNKSMLLFE
jgi:hypothetical protein